MYVLKFNENKVFVEKKLKIIVKDYSWIQKVNFKKIYTVTACLESFCLLLAIVASFDLYLWQLDFVTAYFNSNIDFNMYIEQL